MLGIQEVMIKKYIKSLNPFILGLKKIDTIHIKKLPQGLWNFDYVVKINNKKFVFKIYSKNIPGLPFENSGRNEFLTLKFISKLGMAPKPVHFDDSLKSIKHSVLIYEYAEGETLTFSDKNVIEVAKILATIHSLDIGKVDFLKEKDEDFKKIIQRIEVSFEKYKSRDDADPAEIKSFAELINKAKKQLGKNESVSCPKSLIHTDLVPSNFVVGERVVLIDWQTPAIGDPAFDVWAFTSEPYNRWDLPCSLTKKQKELFLSIYSNLRKDKTLVERIRLKGPLYSLELGLYCVIRYADYKSKKLPEEILKGREENFEKYRRVKNIMVKNLKQFLGL